MDSMDLSIMADGGEETPFHIEDPQLLNFCINGWQTSITCMGCRGHIFQIERRYLLTRLKKDDGVRVSLEGMDLLTHQEVEIEKFSNIFENDLGLPILRQLQIHRALKSSNGIRKILNIMIPVPAALEEEEEQPLVEFEDIYLVYSSGKNLYDELFSTPSSDTLDSSTLVELEELLRDIQIHKMADYFCELVKAVLELHQSSIVHGSIDDSSVVVSTDTTNNKVQLHNFLWSLRVNESYPEEEVQPDEDIQRTILSSTPPEILLGSHGYNKTPYDIWCLGVLLLNMLNGGCGEPPLLIPGTAAATKENQLLHILNTLKPDLEDLTPEAATSTAMQTILVEYTEFIKSLTYMKKLLCNYTEEEEEEENHPPIYHMTYADELSIDLARKMLHFNPAKRISAQSALEHPYLLYTVSQQLSSQVPLKLAEKSFNNRIQLAESIWEEMLVL